jgi:cytochrome c oxidase subunit II
MRNRSVAPLIVIGLLASLSGIALGLVIDWFPTPASTQADPIDTLWDVLLIVSVPVFVLVQAVVLYCVWRWRMRPGQELEDGPPIHGNTRLEVIWTVIPAILIFGLCVYAYVVLEDIETAEAAPELRVNVIGQQFAWTFEYPQRGGEAVTSNQLYLPEGRPVRFFIQSRDVIHDFWVPAFRMKIDAVPGITTELLATPNRTGRFPVVCAELCGIGHAYMRQEARVMPAQEFANWLREEQQPDREEAAGAEGGGGAPDGRALFVEGDGDSAACGACHTLRAAGTNAATGPDLDEVLRGQTAEQVRESIVNPGARITEGFSQGLMPANYGRVYSDEEVDALVDYLVESTR